MLHHIIDMHFVTGFAWGAAFVFVMLFVMSACDLAGRYDDAGTKR